MHICAYLLLVFIAIAAAVYKFDVRMYSKYIYLPLIKILTFNGALNIKMFFIKLERTLQLLSVIK
jgi:hypothetical protein